MSGECDKCGEHALECKDSERIELCSSGLTRRAVNVLKQCGINYVDEIVDLSAQEILEWKNCGKKSLNDIRALLAENNLSLRGESNNIGIPKIILKDLPGILDAIRKEVDEAIRDLRFLSFKLEKISIVTQKKAEKLKN